eukprot:CAMPEP_0206480862 /NCGR_PEP_ID=MMETSP0324_2-20121206/37706_1 /ASSEMBLY_ACC=CAM_ASM_000836 /TAXON_ID=2866 /ORGANISM="Crypthecodinium cohnii, Strain Seligo" /LENGTH=275 /DNA_ID=CAMNT_0053958049 /DNA_START=61 /DNA_END=888 /DNA_ORIENTATION=+
MADKFKMSNGQHGMLRGQAPDAFQKVDPSMPKRSCHDTDFERMPVKPQKTHANSTGFTSQVADIATTGIMEQALVDRLNTTMQKGMEDGYNARLEEEDEDRHISQEELDRQEDSKNIDDDDLEVLRARRRQQMKDAHDKKLKYQALGHGSYDDIEEEAFLKTVTSSERAVVHFHHKMFEKCKVMDMHLGKCARKFFGTRFVRLDAEKAPFFVEKLKIRTLPCVVVFNDGVAVGRQVGFEGLSMGDEFETVQLAWRIKEWGGLEEDFGPEDDIQWV